MIGRWNDSENDHVYLIICRIGCRMLFILAILAQRSLGVLVVPSSPAISLTGGAGYTSITLGSGILLSANSLAITSIR